MTRRIYILLLLPLFLIIFVSVANAENSTTGSAKTTTNSTSALKLKEQMQLLQDEKKTALKKAKEEARIMIQTKREEFKTRVQTIKDQKKKVLVERIDAKIAEVNKNHTARFTEVLSRLQGFLDKISKLTTNSAILADVNAAQTAIDTAKATVETQAAKTYTMTITDDASLRLNAGVTLSQFRQDLQGVYKLVIDAKQAVQKLHTQKAIIKKEASKSAEL